MCQKLPILTKEQWEVALKGVIEGLPGWDINVDWLRQHDDYLREQAKKYEDLPE